MNRKFTRAEAIQLADKLDASEANFYGESSMFFDRDLSGAVGDATEMLRAWPDDSKLLEALEHIAASLYYNDYGDPALLDSFDESIIDAAIRAAKGEA